MESHISDQARCLYLVTHLRTDTEPDAMLKIIGLFDSPEAARSITAEYRAMPGFSRYPDGFSTETLWINRKLWEGGFFSGLDDQA